MSEPKDIFLIMFDTLSAKWMEAALGGACELPGFKRLLKMGTRFPNTYTSNPVCSPARATIATGLSTRGHGVLENGYYLDPELPTFMRQLQRAGYRTGLFGKLHAYPHYAGFRTDCHQYGFDVVHTTEDGRGGEWLDWILEEHPEYADEALATIWAPQIPEFREYGPNKENLYERIEKARKKFPWSSQELTDPTHEAYILPFPKELSQTEWITRHALEFIDQENKSPIFAQISYVQPHGPYGVPEEYLDRVKKEWIPRELPPTWMEEVAPICFGNRKVLTNNPERFRLHYFADLIYMDEQVGMLLDKLEESGRLKDSYIILTADHGDLLGDHGFFGKEERHYDACIRVPLVIAGPGIGKDMTLDCMIQLEDICPTILEMGQTRMPLVPKLGRYLEVDAKEIPAVGGYSLLKAAESPEDWPRSAAYVESYNPVWSMDIRDWARTIVTAGYRYTWYPQNGNEQLFDLNVDKDEVKNLAYNEKYAKVKEQLKAQLMELIVLQDYPKTVRSLYALGVH
ncbi:sulfatase-like hydrolase/transferase [Clostridium sp. AN503]|uniref:sulfatase family protein n=1 Tax=Clostridium sp. AN503 TaxID=3160598 RepID=UPI0034588504